MDGIEHPTRFKENLASRETDLRFLFRTLERNRWFAAMGSEYILQEEEYRSLLIEESMASSQSRNEAFATSIYYDKVTALPLFTDPSKLRLYLTGNVFMGGPSPTVTMDDFTSSTGNESRDRGHGLGSPFRNLVSTLNNIHVVFQLLLSESFNMTFENFIYRLEATRKIEARLVPFDEIRQAVENVLSKFFRVVRTERPTDLAVYIQIPEQCATYLGGLFETLLDRCTDKSAGNKR